MEWGADSVCGNAWITVELAVHAYSASHTKDRIVLGDPGGRVPSVQIDHWFIRVAPSQQQLEHLLDVSVKLLLA